MNKTYTHTIKTSGYSDRYLYRELKITDGTATFRDAEAYAEYRATIGDNYETAWDRAYKAQKNHIMYGKTSPHTSEQITLSDNDLHSVEAYLKIHHSKQSSYTTEAWERWNQQITNHPLTGSLLAIVKWQISQCDRQNLENWGNVNGQE
jgi:hypothetical protein